MPNIALVTDSTANFSKDIVDESIEPESESDSVENPDMTQPNV